MRCSLGVPELLVYPVNPVHPCEINSNKDRQDEQDVSLTQEAVVVYLPINVSRICDVACILSGELPDTIR